MVKINPALGINLRSYGWKILENDSWRISEKVDGVRRLFYKSQSAKVTCWSRTGHEDKWLGHITEFLEAPWFANNLVYDCEIVDREAYLNHIPSFELRTISASKASQQYCKNKLDLMAVCFDIFNPDGDTRTGSERTEMLECCFKQTPLTDPIIIVPIFGVVSGEEEIRKQVSKWMKLVAKRNGEGLMLMSMSSPYIFGRSRQLVKVKRLEEYVGKIIDYELAGQDTKIRDGVAAVICEVKGCSVPVRVGSGFSQEERYLLAKENPIGYEIEIEAFSKSKNKNGDISLSMPIFKRFIDNGGLKWCVF